MIINSFCIYFIDEIGGVDTHLNQNHIINHVVYLWDIWHTYSINMATIRERVIQAIKECAIENLVDRKYQLDESFANGEITYAEYEEHKWLISNELDSLVQ